MLDKKAYFLYNQYIIFERKLHFTMDSDSSDCDNCLCSESLYTAYLYRVWYRYAFLRFHRC